MGHYIHGQRPMSLPPNSEAAPPRPLWRRVLRWIGFGAGGALLLLVATLVAVRAYFSDERLRAMAEAHLGGKLGAPVELAALEASLTSGLELRGLRIGALPGFHEEVLRFERMALKWRLWPLFRLHVVLPEVALEGLQLTLEEGAAGRNLDAVLAALRGPAAPTPAQDEPAASAPAPTAEPAPGKPLEQPELPMRVDVDRIALVDMRVRVLRPDLELALDRIGFEGSFHGEGRALALDLWAGLGERESGGAPSKVLVRRAEPPLAVDGEQRIGFSLRSSGFGDVRMELTVDATEKVTAAQALPAVHLAGGCQVRANLLAERAEVSDCAWSLTERTRFIAALSATDVLRAPLVSLEAMSFTADFDELAPYVTAFAPDMKLAGKLEISAEPTQLAADAAQRLETLKTRWTARLTDLHVDGFGSRVDDLDATASVELDGGVVALDATAALGRAESKGQQVQDVGAHLVVTTPLQPWLGGAPEGNVDTTLEVRVGRAVAGPNQAAGLDMRANTTVPIAIVKGAAASEPITADVEVKLRAASAAAARVNGLRMTLASKAWDLRGERVQARFAMRASEAISGAGERAIRVPALSFGLTMMREGQHVRASDAVFSVADLVRLRGEVDVTEALSPTPVLRKCDFTLEPVDIERALALVPASMRPPAQLSGRAGARFSMQGRVPHAELGAAAALPAPPEGMDPLAAMVAVYGTYLERWAQRFERGLPFTTKMAFTLEDVAFVDAASEVAGLDMTSALELATNGPTWRTTLQIDRLAKPLVVQGLASELTFSFRERTIGVSAAGTIEQIERPDLTRPITKASLDAAMAYRVGGDLTLERFVVAAPDRRATMELAGRIVQPMQLAATRAWEEAGLPGVDVTLRWAMGIENPQSEPLVPGGPGIEGKLGTSGALRVADGVAAITGTIGMKELSVRAGPNAVDSMSGELPFDLRLAFTRRPDAIPVARNLAIGGGEASLITSAEDIRERPARPVYYDTLRRYRRGQGLRARSIISGPHIIEDFELDGRLADGVLVADWVSMHVLGGDVVGNMAFQIWRDRSVRGDVAFKVSNIDASNFAAINVEPGPDSEMNADMRFGFLFAPRRRDLTLNMNVTKIGSKTLDRFLQLLDPEGKDEKIQGNRKNLAWVEIRNVAMWIRYENMNMDLSVRPILRIPFTEIGVPKIERELIRRYALTDTLNAAVQPIIDQTLGQSLGWSDVR